MSRRREDVERLESIQELIEDLWQVPRFAHMRAGFRPNVDCFRTPDPPQLVVVCELAGVGPEDVRIEVSERVLLIAGERRRPALDGPASYQQVEIEWGAFQRRLPLPAEVQPERAEATYDRGFLTVRLPLAPQPPPEPVRVRIAIRVPR
jgi:HSP20 family protein